jgi:3-oxoacyl-[acyl-carrier-protein] synthase II
VAVILALRAGAVPPTINLEDPDPNVDGLDITPNVATRRPIAAALNNSFGFGGQNAALVFKRWDG